jgi:hypothetical protein
VTAAAHLCPICHSDTDKALERLRQEARANNWFTVRLANGDVFAARGDQELEISFDHAAGQIVATLTTTIGSSNPATISDWIVGQQQWEDLSKMEVYGL